MPSAPQTDREAPITTSYKFRTLSDSGASHSYASSTAINLINAKPKSTGLRQIAMLTGVTTRMMQVHEVVLGNVTGDFKLDVNITKIEKRELLSLENPHYERVLDENAHLRGFAWMRTTRRTSCPFTLFSERMILLRYAPQKDCASAVVVTLSPSLLGLDGQSCRQEQTKISPLPGYLAVSSTTDYDNLCALDVLGLADTTGDQADVLGEFKEQLTRSEEGWYETCLPWKGNHPPLPSNHDGSVRRLNSLLRKLRRTDMLAEYDAVVREQLKAGVVEKAPDEITGKEFYLPHRAVVRENAESTKVRVVYDASARAHNNAPSLNECLYTGPPLQNQLWSVITRNGFHAVAVAGDLQKAFLQVRVREAERDVLPFHWIVDL